MSRRSPPTSKSPRWSGSSSILWRAALLVIVGCCAYANSLSGPFVFDDENSIVSNPAIRSFGTVLRERLDSPIAGRPLVGVTFAANFALNQLDVTGYHLVNISIHLACALLLFGIIRRTLMLPRLRDAYGRAAPDLAFASALVWTVHPLNTEAVNYITQRTESLMALFYLLTLYACIRSVASARGGLWQTIAVAACALGMGCKETMVTAPVTVALYERVFVFDSFTRAFKARWRLYGGLALTWLVLLYFILPGPRAGSAGFSTSVHPWTYLLNQSVMIVRYVRLVFWPRDLAIHYGPPIAVTLGGVLPYALAVTALLLLTLLALRWKPPLGFLGLWMFLTLAPTSSVVPIATEVAAERRMYLPLMAVVALLVCGSYGIASVRRRLSRNGMAAAVAVISIALATVTFARNREYQSGLVLAQTALERWPSDLAHGAVGSELARLRRDEEAIPELRLGARSDPRTRYNLGLTLFNVGKLDDTIAELTIFVEQDPMREEAPWARRMMGHAYALQHKWPQAIGELRLVLSMTPSDRQARRLLVDTYGGQGVELANAGKFQEAASAFRQALELDPQRASVRHDLAAALFDAGDMAGAMAEAQRNVDIHPTDAGSYDLLGRALAMQGKLDEALAQLEQASRLQPDDPAIRDDLQRVRAARKQR